MEVKNNYRRIDFDIWPRRDHFLIFGQGEYPYLGLTTAVDVGKLRAWCLEKGKSFFNAFLFVMMKSLNQIENFRYRIFEGEIIVCDRVDPSFNIVDADSGTSYFAIAPMTDDFEEFNAGVESAKASALQCHAHSTNRLDLVHTSFLPWFSVSDIIQPMGLSANGSIPRCVWGTIQDNGKTVNVPFSVTGHHGLFDGMHISLLLSTMAASLDRPDQL